MSGRNVTLRIYVEPGKEDRVGWAMDSLKRSMRWDEEAFGREYDLDIFMIVAVSDFNMGAMENKGLNIFNDKYILALPETATDVDYVNIEAIIAHARQHVELLQLFVIADNLPVRRLYASLGFVEYGIERHATKYHGEYHDDVLMALSFMVDSAAAASCAPNREISAEEVSA